VEEQYEPSPWDRIEPTLYGLAMLIMNVGLVAAGLAAAYLLYGLLGGGLGEFNSLARPDRLRVLGNITLASSVLKWGLAAAAIGGGYAFRNEESTGYILAGGGAAIGLGIPYAVRTFAGAQNTSFGSTMSLAGFVAAMYIPAAVGALLIVVDVIRRGVGTVKERPISLDALTYGGTAQEERRPVRTSLLAKCWEGGYCRDFIRPHCPIFLSRKACWREKRGCYCEEDIVSAAAAKVQGVVLDMAPDPKYNFANASAIGGGSVGAIGGGHVADTFRKPELSAAQKRERCRNCVIYNSHQQEKYKLLVPAVLLGGIALCVLFAPLMRGAVNASLTMAQTIVNKASFTVGTPTAASPLVHPGETVEWIFVGAFTIMIVSKLLQMLEWACFKVKI
jgi:hypothetical protein